MRGVFCEGPYFRDDLIECYHRPDEAEEALRAIQEALMVDPEMGDLVRRTGGCRKGRWQGRGHGKRGGVRFLYLHVPAHNRFLLIAAYAKGDQADLTADEKQQMALWAEAYRASLEKKQQLRKEVR